MIFLFQSGDEYAKVRVVGKSVEVATRITGMKFVPLYELYYKKINSMSYGQIKEAWLDDIKRREQELKAEEMEYYVFREFTRMGYKLINKVEDGDDGNSP